MRKVRGFYVDNRLGHLQEALAVANSPNGGEYPVGTIIQLIPHGCVELPVGDDIIHAVQEADPRPVG